MELARGTGTGRCFRGERGGGCSGVVFTGRGVGAGLLVDGLGAMGGGFVAGFGTVAGLSTGMFFARNSCLSLCRSHAGLLSSEGPGKAGGVPF